MEKRFQLRDFGKNFTSMAKLLSNLSQSVFYRTDFFIIFLSFGSLTVSVKHRNLLYSGKAQFFVTGYLSFSKKSRFFGCLYYGIWF